MLVWSLVIAGDWVAGMASYSDQEQCELAKEIILRYQRSMSKIYIECKLIEREE